LTCKFIKIIKNTIRNRHKTGGNFGSAGAAVTLPFIASSFGDIDGWRYAITIASLVAIAYGIFYYFNEFTGQMFFFRFASKFMFAPALTINLTV
jgi:hypothetical protein